MALWMPILVAAVIVFVVSSIVHMMLPYHKSDYLPVPNQDQVMAALRPFNLPAGDYMMPKPASMADYKSPAFAEKMKEGPCAIMTVYTGHKHSMVGSLVQWFVYSIVVGTFAAYIAGRALGPGASYLTVFRFAGATAFLGYSAALVQSSIWMRRSWVTTLKGMFDGLLYGLLTAGTFGWLWPSA